MHVVTLGIRRMKLPSHTLMGVTVPSLEAHNAKRRLSAPDCSLQSDAKAVPRKYLPSSFSTAEILPRTRVVTVAVAVVVIVDAPVVVADVAAEVVAVVVADELKLDVAELDPVEVAVVVGLDVGVLSRQSSTNPSAHNFA